MNIKIKPPKFLNKMINHLNRKPTPLWMKIIEWAMLLSMIAVTIIGATQ